MLYSQSGIGLLKRKELSKSFCSINNIKRIVSFMLKIDQDYRFPGLQLDLRSIGQPQTGPGPVFQVKKSSPDFLFTQGNLSGISTIGTRKHNLDKFQVKNHNTDLLVGLYDGHGGGKAVKYVQQFLLSNIISNEWYMKDLQKAISQSFQSVDAQIMDFQSQEDSIDGCVAIVVVRRGDMLTIANLGDCRAFIIHQDSFSIIESKQLSIDHTPENPAEEKRVKDKGGLILRVGKCLRINGQLNVTRSFGDKKIKKLLGNEPDIVTYKASERDKMLVLATDGLWSITNQKLVADLAIREYGSENVAQSILFNLKIKPSDNTTLLCLKL